MCDYVSDEYKTLFSNILDFHKLFRQRKIFVESKVIFFKLKILNTLFFVQSLFSVMFSIQNHVSYSNLSFKFYMLVYSVRSNLQYAQKSELSAMYTQNNRSDSKSPKNEKTKQNKTKQNLAVPLNKSVKVESSTELVVDIFLPTTVSNVVDMKNIWNERRILKKKVCERSVSRHFATIHRQVYYM